ncbi:hypothetical protein BM525_21625 (plasmid) [Alteromonas mediterranea]|uniref:Thioredoxin-like fold domain-containing protein n=1 Tax=Alteromonas mediterranea TaxID=314275 RepID=A0AAC9NUB7_9ALTE|nr:thioredoxin fold domain-containing protein [Alteromonas mediterranea]APD92462.1 hypothetical protein BM524_21405 [Alteromonas mediterranea]APE00323.1 hypothetical protein BM525_21625 [Alteromonas mediterranea]
MKINGLLKTVAVSVALATSAFAVNADVMSDTEVEVAVTNLKATLSESGVKDNVVSTLKTDGTLVAYQDKVKGHTFPVLFADSYFITDSKGEALIKPDAAFVSTEGKLARASEVLVPLVFEDSKDKWFKHELPEGVEHVGDMYVVTDPTCGYCRKVEQELDDYLNNGIVVHYIPFPRSGIIDKTKPGYEMWLQAACAENPAVAYRDIMLGNRNSYTETAEKESCTGELIDEGYQLGKSVSVSGTPFIYLSTKAGQKLTWPGYLPSKDLMKRAGIEQ